MLLFFHVCYFLFSKENANIDQHRNIIDQLYKGVHNRCHLEALQLYSNTVSLLNSLKPFIHLHSTEVLKNNQRRIDNRWTEYRSST